MNKTIMKIQENLFHIFIYLLLISACIIVILPVGWIIISSFLPGNTLYISKLDFSILTFAHYKELFATDYWRWYLNTFIIAFCNMVISLVLCMLTAYICSRYFFKGKKLFMLGMVILQMFPSFLALVAVYMLIKSLGLLNTYLGLLLIYSIGSVPGNTWLIKGFLDQIARELDESAMLDGCGHLQRFWYIILPLSRPIMVFLAFISFSGPWFDFILPSVLFTRPEMKTLAVGLFEWVSSREASNYTLFTAGALLIGIPITILFACVQKHIKSFLGGAVKG